MPNHSRNSGTRPILGIGLEKETSRLQKSSQRRDQPMRTPRGTPSAKATAKPSSARDRLAAVSSSSWPFVSIDQKVAATDENRGRKSGSSTSKASASQASSASTT